MDTWLNDFQQKARNSRELPHVDITDGQRVAIMSQFSTFPRDVRLEVFSRLLDRKIVSIKKLSLREAELILEYIDQREFWIVVDQSDFR